jgi:hypothetical protein
MKKAYYVFRHASQFHQSSQFLNPPIPTIEQQHLSFPLLLNQLSKINGQLIKLQFFKGALFASQLLFQHLSRFLVVQNRKGESFLQLGGQGGFTTERGTQNNLLIVMVRSSWIVSFGRGPGI